MTSPHKHTDTYIKLPLNSKMYTCLLFGVVLPAYELENILTKYLLRNVTNKRKQYCVLVRPQNQTI